MKKRKNEMVKTRLKKTYTVYRIEFDNRTIYYGRTQDIVKREKQHNYQFKKGKDKQLYNYLRERGIQIIKLIPIRIFYNKVSSKRFELYLILDRWLYCLDNNIKYDLEQRIPSITDRF